jgi:hypothetical protein
VQDVHRRFAPAERIADRLITVTGAEGHPSLTPELRFVLGHALMSSVRAALLDEPALIARPAFEDALVRLALGLLPALNGRRLRGRSDRAVHRLRAQGPVSTAGAISTR